MNERKIKQVLLIHPLKFVCESFKRFAGAQDVGVFYLEQPEPFLYLVKDLTPDVVVIHESFVEELHDDLEGVGILGVPIVVIGDAEGHLTISQPIDLSLIVDQLSNTLARNA